MAGLPYLFACDHPQGEAQPSDPVRLPYLSCPKCRDQDHGDLKEHLQHLALQFTGLATANLAEMSQLLWEILQLRTQAGRAPEFQKLMAPWTRVLTSLLTPSQYEVSFLSAVLRAHGFGVLCDVAGAGAHSFQDLHALWSRCETLLQEIRAAPGGTRAESIAAMEVTLRQANDSVLIGATLLIERDGEEEGAPEVPDPERLRLDYDLQLLLCDALSCAYEHQDTIAGALWRVGEGRARALRWTAESVRSFWLACVRVRMRALDLVRFRGD